MECTILNEYVLGDMHVVYRTDESKHVSLQILPLGVRSEIGEVGYSESLVQIHLCGDAYNSGFSAGMTMRGTQTTENLILKEQWSEKIERRDGDVTFIITSLQDKRDNGLFAEHVLEYHDGDKALSCYTNIFNTGMADLCLEMVSTVSLIGAVVPKEDPFGKDVDRFKIHRFRTKWSSEGREDVRSLQDLYLEETWPSWGNFSERFGCIGSMPVRSYFPYVSVEDTKTGVVTALKLCGASSWQEEISRRDHLLCLSGGLADYEFGHWRKVLTSGNMLQTPAAYVTCCRSNDLAAQRIVRTETAKAAGQHQTMEGLPVLFNEYCTSWGMPTQSEVASLLSILKEKDIDTFVIDAGWYADDKGLWQGNMGDWIVNEKQFPDGIQATVKAIHEAGFKAGVWFEPEVIGPDARIGIDQKHVLKRHGFDIVSGTRRFWDMRDPWAQQYLKEKVIDFLKDNRFDYVKMDYNENIGVGCDLADGDPMDSEGEGLRQSVLASEAFYKSVREEIPWIELEICSSGGHRLVPEFSEMADYLSFSDAHEEKEIPIIAASLQRLIPPSKSQIWAVIREADSLQRIVYSMVSAMYGVLCLSGDVQKLKREQWDKIDEGIAFYRRASTCIARGTTYYPMKQPYSFRAPEGVYGTVRLSDDKKKILVIVHAFALKDEANVTMSLSDLLAGIQGLEYHRFEIAAKYEAAGHEVTFAEGVLSLKMRESFDAVAVLLT